MPESHSSSGFFGRLLRHPRWVLAAWIALATLTAPGLLRLGHDNSPEVYFVRDHESLQHYERFAQSFGDFGALRLWAAGKGVWTPDGLSWLAGIEDRAPRVDGVVFASGPATYHRALAPDADWPPRDLEAYRKSLSSDALARNADLVSSRGDTVGVLLALGHLDPAKREALLATLEDWLARRPAGIEAGIAGLATVNRALDQALAGVLLRQLPTAMLLGILLVAVTLRSAREVTRTVLFAAVCQTVLLGIMGYCGASLNVVTSVLPLLIFVLSLATGIHLVCDARESARGGLSAKEAVLATYRRKAWPVIWTALTTGAAFGSLAWSDSPPVRSLGSWSAAGIGIVLLAALTFYPVLLSEGRRPAKTLARTRFEAWARALGDKACSLSLARGKLVNAVFGPLFLLALAGLPRLEIETSVLEYFGREHPERQRIEAIERHGMGSVSAELVLEVHEGGFAEPERRERLRRLTEQLRASEPALGVLSLADLPDSEAPFFRRARAVLVTDDGATGRVSIAVPFAGFTRLEPFFDRIVALARETFPEAVVSVTGPYPMVLAAQRNLFAAMMVSLGMTLLVVIAVLLVLVRGRRLKLAAVLPNLWPVAVALGTMGWFGVALDSGTMMIAAVVLGLAVDDTLHFLGGLRAAAPESEPKQAIRATLVRLAPAHILTSTVLTTGFLTLATSDFLPVARFGVISAVAVSAALAGDLVWVPALAAGRTPDDSENSG